jgi:hypothetical protein
VWRVTMLLKGARGLGASQMFEGLLNDHAPYLINNKSLAGRHLKKSTLQSPVTRPAAVCPTRLTPALNFGSTTNTPRDWASRCSRRIRN